MYITSHHFEYIHLETFILYPTFNDDRYKTFPWDFILSATHKTNSLPEIVSDILAISF